jgi:hypothetical protein
MIQLLTPTGARHQAWELCIKYMAAQDYQGPVHWVIVDDGPNPQTVPDIPGWRISVIYPKDKWQKGQNTQNRNLLVGIKHLSKKHPVLFIEDDEHYHPSWISVCAEHLQHHKLIGQALCRKYSLAKRAWSENTYNHASLCCTAISGSMISKFKAIVERNQKLADIQLWNENVGHLIEGAYVTGIKCMPGRGGIDSGHRESFAGHRDGELNVLKKWIGADAENYYPYIKGAKCVRTETMKLICM